jgi:hypothetical protein
VGGHGGHLDAIQWLEHDDAVSADNDHTNFVVLLLRNLLDGIIQSDIHEGIESTQDAGNLSVGIQFN